VADTRDLSQIIANFRERADENERRMKRRIAITAVLCVFVAGYMTWMHAQISKLDAEAVMDIARAQVEAKLPELGEELTTRAMEAAPDLMDQGEAAVMRVPSMLRDTVEARLDERADGLIDDMATRLADQLSSSLDTRLERLAEAGEDGRPPALDDLMTELREQYRTKAGSLVAELYVAYAKEIGGVNDYLIHLRDSQELNERERIRKQIIHASVALRQHYIEPIAPVGVGATESVDSGE